MAELQNLVSKAQRPILLTFDAFHTLYRPRKPIVQQYLAAANRHGVRNVNEDANEKTFAKVFQSQVREKPNYGYGTNMTPIQWWTQVIEKILQKDSETLCLPESMITELWNSFSTNEAYKLMTDVAEFFEWLRRRRQDSAKPKIVTGVITNSDSRVSEILRSLGLKISSNAVNKEFSMADSDADLDFVMTSHEVGIAKPQSGIFDIASRLAGLPPNQSGSVHRLHVGDSIRQDVVAAFAAGWHGIKVDQTASLPRQYQRLKEAQAIDGCLFATGSRFLTLRSLSSLPDIIEKDEGLQRQRQNTQIKELGYWTFTPT